MNTKIACQRLCVVVMGGAFGVLLTTVGDAASTANVSSEVRGFVGATVGKVAGLASPTKAGLGVSRDALTGTRIEVRGGCWRCW